MKNKRIFIGILLVLLVALFFGVLFSNYFLKKEIISDESFKNKANGSLSIYSWWTAKSESAALNSLLVEFKKEYPNINIASNLVEGGAGFKMANKIKGLVAEKNTPDSFLMHAGYEGLPYFKAGFLASIDDIWESENLNEVIPSVIQDMSKFKGKHYSVPVSVHRVNVVWYNKRILKENNIEAPDIENWNDFFNVCEKLRKNGIEYPVQVADSWTIAHVFEQMVASEGIEFYQDWINGKIVNRGNEKLIKVFYNLERYLSYANIDGKELTWDEAIGKVIKEESVFNIMGDWAGQEFEVAEKWYGIDYGNFPVPGTKEYFGLSIDTFQRLQNAKHPNNTNHWLKFIASREGQDAFNPLKGSISARTDANISKYNAYQKSAVADFWKARYMFPSVVHGSGAPNSFKVKLEEVIFKFSEDLDIKKAIIDLTDFTIFIKDEYAMNWSLK